MAREWSERHIRDLVRSEWVKIEGGGGGGIENIVKDIVDAIMNEFKIALSGVEFTANTMDIKQNSFYEYHNIRVNARIIPDSVRIEKSQWENDSSRIAYDIYFDYSGYVSLGDNRQGEITQNKRIGAIPKYVDMDITVISPGTHYLETFIGLVSYSLSRFSESAQPAKSIPEDIKLIFGYSNESANKPDIIIKETGEELSLETAKSMPMYQGGGLYVIRTMTDFNTDNYMSRTFGGSRHIRVLYDIYNMTVAVNLDETVMDS